MKQTFRLNKASGFTLIEVLVVVVILSILAALIVPRIMDRPDQARMIAAKSDIQAITNALKLYRLDNGVYPTTEQGLRGHADAAADWVLIASGYDRGAVAALAAGELGEPALVAMGAMPGTVVHGLFDLAYAAIPTDVEGIAITPHPPAD